uniref:DUF148 domain-containing protein n=1 Tax=Heligmosomoides polygyrus TaxID=6339 RepID=A0A183F1W0_HELPZ
LPPFTEDLPEDAQAKIKEIWKDYKEGEKCYEQHGLTREVMDSLPKDVRRKLHKGPPLPPFLKKAPKDIQEQFQAIFKDKSIPFDDKPEKINELAQKVLKGDLLKEFNEFHKKMEEHRKSILSPDAKKAYDKLSKLEKEKHEIINGLDDKIQEELFDIFRAKHMFPKPL